MDDYAFVNMLSYGKTFSQDQIFVEEFKVYLDRVLTYDKSKWSDYLYYEKCNKRNCTAAGNSKNPHCGSKDGRQTGR